MPTDDNEPVKMTIYPPPELVDEIDALKLEDQAAGRVSRNMGRPAYIVWVLREYASHRRQTPTKIRKR